MEALRYLLEVTICWSLFYGIYYAFLRRVTFHGANRWYLLLSLIGGLLIPLLRHLSLDLGQSEIAAQVSLVAVIQSAPAMITSSTDVGSPLWLQTLWLVYALGVLAGVIRISRSLWRIRSLYATGRRTYHGAYTLVETTEAHLPFSFLRSIYVSGRVSLGAEYDDILSHERAHVDSRHTYDVLLIELIAIAFWFHPLVYLYRSAVRQTHEYLADSAAVHSSDKKNYSKMLLEQSMSGFETALAHHFFHSHIKKRIDMMYQKKSGPSAWLKYALALPVLLLLTVAFARQINKESPDSPQTMEASVATDPDDEIFKVVDRMPMFPSEECAGVSDHKERRACADQDLLKYLFENVKYPKEAMKEGLQGRVYVQFIVEKDGSVTNAKILRDIGGGCGEEAQRVVMGMNDLDPWTPGYQDGKAVRVYYTLPIVYRLNESGPDQLHDATPPPAGKMVTGEKNQLPDDVFAVVDEMPMFPGCRDVADHDERKACADMALLKYLYTNVKYPESARKDGIQGRVYVQFIVNPDGRLSDFKVARSPNESMSGEVLRVIETMNNMDERWSPGIKDGKAVKVIYTLPVVFKLEDNPDSGVKGEKTAAPAALHIDKAILQQSGVLTFAMESVATSADVQLLNMDGRVLHSTRVQTSKGANKISLNVGSISTGIYVLKVDSGDQSITQKITAQ